MAGAGHVQINQVPLGVTGKPVSFWDDARFAGTFAALLSGHFQGGRSVNQGPGFVMPGVVSPAHPAVGGTAQVEKSRIQASATGGPRRVEKFKIQESPDGAISGTWPVEKAGVQASVTRATSGLRTAEKAVVQASITGATIGSRPVGKVGIGADTLVPEPSVAGMAPLPPAVPRHEAPAGEKAGKKPGKETAPVAHSVAAGSYVVHPAADQGVPVDQSPPGIILTALGLLAQTRGMQTNSQPRVLMPLPASGTSVAAAPYMKEAGIPKTMDPHRAEARGEQPVRNDRPEQTPISARPASDAVKSEPGPAKFDAAPETARTLALSASSQPVSSGSETSPSSRLDQDQPAQAPDRTTPAEQIAPALVGMLKTADGTQSVTVRLQPPELGQVQIRVGQAMDGTARVDITTEKTETLQLLQRDQPRLDQALDLAGVPSAGRSVTFQVVAPDPAGASVPRPDSTTSGSGDSGQGQSGGAWRQSGDSHNDPDSGQGPDQQKARAFWFRAGLDITA
jgi:hypothetical protein